MVFKALRTLTPAFPSSLISRHSPSSALQTVQPLQVPQCPSNSPSFTRLRPATAVLSALLFLIHSHSSCEMPHKPYHLQGNPFLPLLWTSSAVPGMLTRERAQPAKVWSHSLARSQESAAKAPEGFVLHRLGVI